MIVFSPLVEQAIELAAEWHDGTYRKSRWRPPMYVYPETDAIRVPVMAHVTAVAMSVQRAGFDDETVAAAFLHDVLEDPNRHGQRYRHEQLSERMGERVTRLVGLVTERKHDAAGRPLPWKERKDGYLVQLGSGLPEAVGISLADKVHNLYTMNESLAQGLDVFSAGPERKPLSAGPTAQLWFYSAVAAVAEAYDDERLPTMQDRLQTEIDRFRKLTPEGH